MDGLVVTRSNFKSMRQSYGIKVKDVSEKCGLSEGCINSFENSTGAYTETNAREYNKQAICRALEELINNKILNAFDAPVQKTEKVEEVKEKKSSLGGIFADTDLLREDLVNYMRNYCKYNQISIDEFCSMCKINRVYCTPSAAARDGKYVRLGTLNRVLEATGWTKEMIKAGFKPEQHDIPKAKPAAVVEKKETAQEKFNKKCTMENGKYFIEYDILVPQHVCKEISKEEFLKEVSG